MGPRSSVGRQSKQIQGKGVGLWWGGVEPENMGQCGWISISWFSSLYYITKG